MQKRCVSQSAEETSKGGTFIHPPRMFFKNEQLSDYEIAFQDFMPMNQQKVGNPQTFHST